MKTTTIGLRLNDYQLEKLNEYAEKNHLHRMDFMRLLLESVIDGKIEVSHGKVIIPEPVVEEEVDLSKFEKLAEKKRMSTQGLLDLIAEQLGA